MTTPLNGLLGGLIVGVLATASRRALGARDLLSRRVWTAVAGSDPVSPRIGGALLGVAYGGLVGAAIVALELLVGDALAVPPDPLESLAVGVGGAALTLALWLGAWQLTGDGGDWDPTRARRLPPRVRGGVRALDPPHLDHVSAGFAPHRAKGDRTR